METSALPRRAVHSPDIKGIKRSGADLTYNESLPGGFVRIALISTFIIFLTGFFSPASAGPALYFRILSPPNLPKMSVCTAKSKRTDPNEAALPWGSLCYHFHSALCNTFHFRVRF